MRLQENTTFANRYQLERLLGRGGFREVWLAKDNFTKLNIAIKVYAPGQGMDSDGLAEFSAELAGVFNLNHTNLLKPTHVDTWEGMPYLILPYCSRGSISKQIGKMQEDEIWKLIHDVASGLAYLHENDIVHQDIKPDNILIDEVGNYVITDFGISTRARSTLRKSVVGGSASGGTTAYMGPERFSRQPAPTKASDVWSFGAMVYEVLEGNVPFGEVGGGLQKSGAEIPFIEANVSDALKFTVYKMLSKETWDRPTAETLVAWSQNPQSIEIDYGLLTSEETPATPEPEPTPEPTPAGTSRPTQRLQGSTAGKETTKIGNTYQQQETNPTKSTSKGSEGGGGSKAWIWILVLLLVVIGTPIGIGIHNQREQERIEAEKVRQKLIAEEKRQRELEEKWRNTTLNVTPACITDDGEGQSITITVNTNADNWTINDMPSWCSYKNKKSNSFLLVVNQNPNSHNRTGAFTIKANGKTQSISISQESSMLLIDRSKNKKFSVKGISFNMIYVEGGTFIMGATKGQTKSSLNTPTHEVKLSSYYIGETEITSALWFVVMRDTVINDNYPKVNISWVECQEFCERLNSILSEEITGWTFSIPTEAQWEYAARGGKYSKGYKYSGSNKVNEVGWVGKIRDDSHLYPVRKKKPNELGIYDMSGNVNEWCFDWWLDHYEEKSQVDPKGPSSGLGHVTRGGAFFQHNAGEVSERRWELDYNGKPHEDFYTGLRIALTKK